MQLATSSAVQTQSFGLNNFLSDFLQELKNSALRINYLSSAV